MVERLLRFLDKHQRWFGWPLIVGASLFSLLLALAKPTIIEQIELKTLDERFRLRGPMLAPKNVVIVAIDDESIAKLGRWPWPRATMARLIEALFARYHARAVGLDIVFSEASRNPLHESAEIAKKMDAPAELLAWLRAHTEKADPDAALAQVAHRYRDRLVLGYFFYPDPRKAPAIVRAHFDQEAKKLKTSAMSVRIEGGKRLIGPPEMRAIEGNIAPLASSGAAQGFFNFFPDSDGMVRRVPLVARIGDVGYPNLDLQLLRAGMGWPEAIVRAGPAGVDGIQIANHRIPTDETGKMLLNHYGPRGSFAHVPAWRVLAGSADASLLRDAYVLVGATAIGVYDFRPSPFDAAFPGVEGHAAAVANVLEDKALQRPDAVVVGEYLAAWLLPLVLGAVVYRRGAVAQSAAVIGGPLVVLALGYWLFVRWGVWMKVSYLIVGTLAATLPVALLRYVIEAYKRAFIHDAFAHYLAPEVVAVLEKHPEYMRLGGEVRFMTAMFSDIAGFSTFSERMRPDELVHFLNRYLGEMSDIILEFGGTIDKYEGDAIISFFGAPIEMPDHALRAVRAALAQQQRLAELRALWAQEGLPPVHTRIGINSGEMLVGNMGTEKRMNYTIMGDNVNLASRLEGVCKVYRVPILMSRETYLLVREAIHARFIDRVRVVGRTQPVDIYLPLGDRGTVDPETLKIARAYERAWDMMRRRMFKDAERIFAELALEYHDPPSEVMLARIKRYLAHPPPEDWTAVYQLEQK